MTDEQSTQPGRLVASQIMLEEVPSIGADLSLDEARRQLIALQSDSAKPNALLVVEEDGRYAGILTARLLLKHLLGGSVPEGSPVSDEERWYDELLTASKRCALLKVREVLAPELPVVAPDDGLALMIKHACEQRMEFVPVVENGRPLGVVPITAIFTAAAALALRPDDEGIQVGGERVT